MTKKAVALILAAILAGSAAASLASCEKKPTHEEILSEIASGNDSYHQKRRAFHYSEVYSVAVKYLEDTFRELIPGCEMEISLEPGRLIDSDLTEFSDFTENAETRTKFFHEAALSFKVNFWDFEKDGEEFAKELVARQISGRMTPDNLTSDHYDLDAVEQTVVFVVEPEP